MRSIVISRFEDQKIICQNGQMADSLWERIVGLLRHSSLAPGDGLWIEPCNSIHSFFMKFAIDVVYLDSGYRVLKIRKNYKPWRMDFPVFGAKAVLELPVGGAGDLKEGDILCLS